LNKSTDTDNGEKNTRYVSPLVSQALSLIVVIGFLFMAFKSTAPGKTSYPDLALLQVESPKTGKDLRKLFSDGIVLRLRREKLLHIDANWLKHDFRAVWTELVAKLYLDSPNKQEDIDLLVRLYKTTLDTAFSPLLQDNKRGVANGVAIIQTTNHSYMINVVGTNEGWFVVNVLNGEVTSLKSFSEFKSIRAIEF